jgi:UDPglucose--hexose-1-phosphate uridylyltransferase
MAAAAPSPTDPDRAPRIHVDPLSGRVAFAAPGRADRPDDAALLGAAGAGPTADAGSGPRAWCPFCLGNESRTPAAVLRAPTDEAVPWHARIVPNRYPLTTSAAGADHGHGRLATGVHDVVIESAAHERSILAVAPADWRDVWQLCQARIAGLAAAGQLAWATVFKNSGGLAGASLEHLHSQLVGLDFVPPAVAAEFAALERETDAFARLLAAAERDGRIVAESAGVVAVVPPAPRQPFETWILPLSPTAAFHAAPAEQVAALADLTRWFVGRLELAPNADYNWWLHDLPFAGHEGCRGRWHWHLEIMPRLSPLAGFELGTGCHISPLPPAESARLLRGS